MSNRNETAGPARREILTALAGVAAAAAATLPAGEAAAQTKPAATAAAAPRKGKPTVSGSYVTTREGVSLYVKDWGPKDGPVVTLSHGWPLSSDSWENQAFFLANNGFRVVSHDRRGHGRSSQPWDGNDMDHYADDLGEVIEALDLRNVSAFGFSTGGGEVARYAGRHGTGRIAKLGLISAVPPVMVKKESNPGGLPIEVFDGIRKAFLADRAQLFRDIASGPFFGYNRPGAKASQGAIEAWYAQGMQAGFKNTFDSIKAFSETDFTADLKKFDRPTLIVHGDDDQIVPLDASGRASKKLVPHAILKVYEGAPHGLSETHKDRLNQDMLAFLRA
ncbi:MAG: alpha/beta hydrolase [Chelatococcus sp.]|nr:MAG: alpha/beta hydrolase [Chelatococcus sp.]